MADSSLQIQGQIVAAFGRQYLVRLADGSEMTCLTRGKKSEAACGDWVEVRRTGYLPTRPVLSKIEGLGTGSSAEFVSGSQGVIERIAPRRSLLYRSDPFREKIIAANVTQIIVVVAAEPSFSDELLARCLVAAYDQKLEVLIVLNKCDLLGAAEAARNRLASYSAIGYRVLELSAKIASAPSTLENAEQPASQEVEGRLLPPPGGGRIVEGVDSLRPFLTGHSSVLVGQSGMGKSTLINALLPDAQAATREISSALDSGKHTTTHARLYRLDNSSNLIDCPGVQAFGLHHLSFGRIEQGFVEFAQYLGQCRFHDCHHLHEPGCALRNAVEAGKLDARRLALFQHITAARH